jgi:endonuclease-3
LDLLVLLILNQSTSDLLADRAFGQLRQDYDSYHEILAANDPEALANSIRVCGLAPSKARYILGVLAHLHRHYGLDPEMEFLRDLDDDQALRLLTDIPGIGIKSASCLLMFSFHRGVFPIDTHVLRVFRRLGGLLRPKVGAADAHRKLHPYLNGPDAYHVHVAVIELGRKVCLPRQPKCHSCYLLEICEFGRERLARAETP